MKLVPNMSKDTKQTLLAGVAGGLIYDMETVANGLVTGYPQFLKDRLIPELPRNGQLVADLAPLAVGWGVGRKHSARNDSIKMGLTLFALPKLMQEIVWNTAYMMGRPLGLPLRLVMSTAPMPRAMNNVSYVPQPSVNIAQAGGRYAIKASPPTSRSSGIGKYR